MIDDLIFNNCFLKLLAVFLWTGFIIVKVNYAPAAAAMLSNLFIKSLIRFFLLTIEFCLALVDSNL